MKKLIIHIGARKAGSTTIQKTLAKNNDALHARGGHYVQAARLPESRGDGQYAHHRAAPLDGDFEHWARIAQEIRESRYETFIVSSELLYTIEREKIQEIRKHAKEAGIEAAAVLMVKRRPIDFVKSEYKQQIKFGREARNIVAFAQAHIRRCDHEGALQRWASVFEDGETIVLELEAFKGSGRGLVETVCQTIGLGGLGLKEERLNESLDDKRVCVLRLINRVAGRLGLFDVSEHAWQLKNSVKRGRRIGQAATRALAPFVPERPYEEHEIEQVRALFAKHGLLAR